MNQNLVLVLPAVQASGQNVTKLNTKAIMRWDIDACPSLPSSVKTRFKDKYQIE